MIAKGYKTNFETLKRAFAAGDVALMECTDRKTGKTVVVLCAVSPDDGEFVFSPFAKMFDDNPYEELIPPDSDDGTIKDKRARALIRKLSPEKRAELQKWADRIPDGDTDPIHVVLVPYKGYTLYRTSNNHMGSDPIPVEEQERNMREWFPGCTIEIIQP